MGSWWLKFSVCVAYDLMDMTIGRTLFLVPFAGEFGGAALGYAMFGKQGLFAAWKRWTSPSKSTASSPRRR